MEINGGGIGLNADTSTFEEALEKANIEVLWAGFVRLEKEERLPAGSFLKLISSGRETRGDKTYSCYEIRVPDRRLEDAWMVDPKEIQVAELEVGDG